MTDRSFSYEFRANLSSFKAQFAAGRQYVRDFGNDLTALDRKGERMRRGLDELGGTAGKAGLVLGGAFVAVATKAANFEQAMSFVQSATHETASAMQDLSDAALDAGKRTAFSATEAAGGIEELAKAGVATKDILGGGLDGALDLAAAGGLRVADAAETAASAMTQFKLSGEDVPHIADLLAAGASKAQGSVSDLGMALNQSGLVAAQTGLSIEEATGALSAFASAGLLGSDSGTAFKTMLLALVPKSEQSGKVMENLGFSAFDANGKFVGLAETATRLRDALAGYTDEQRLSYLQTIFGTDAIRAANVLYEQGGEGIQRWIDKVNDSGFASETAAIRMDNLKGDIEQLGGALETAFIGAGDGQTGFLRDLTQNLTGLVNAFNELPGPVKSATGSLLGVAALGAGGFWFTSKAITTMANTRQALADLGIQAGSTRGRLSALNTVKFAGIVTALATLGEGIEQAFDANINTSDLERNLEALVDGKVSDDLKHLADDLTTLSSKTNKLAEPLQELVHLPTPWGSLLGDTPIDRATSNIEAVDQALANMVESGNIDQARSAFAQLLEVIRQQGGSQRDAIEQFDAFGTALDNAAESGAGVADATSGVGDSAKTAAPKVDGMSEALKKAREEAKGTAESFLDLTAGVDDGKFSFREWLKSLQETTAAVRDLRVNANTAGGRGLDQGLVQSLQEMGKEGAVQLAYLAQASDDEIEQANRAWRRYQRQVARTTEAIAGDIAEIDGLSAKPTINTDSLTGAEKAANDLYESLIRLTGIGGIGKPKKPDERHPAGLSALYADGGYTGMGGKYEPAGTVHRREFVFSAEATDGNEAALDQLHRSLKASPSGTLVPPSAMQQSSDRGWSTSGMLGVTPVAIDYERLGAEVAKARPLYGDVHLQPHDYGQFRREMADDQRRAAIGGY